MTTVDPAAAADPPPPKRGLSTLAKVLIGVGVAAIVLAALIGLLVWSVFAMTSGPVDAAGAFFAATARSGPAVSYNLASPSFRSVVPEAQWESYARRYGLAGYTRASWSSRSITNNVAVLQGSLTVGGGALPATVQLTNAGGGWQVLHLKLADGGVSGGSASDMAAASANTTSDADATTPPAAASDMTSNTDGVSGAPVTAPSATTRPDREIPAAMLSGLCRQVLAQQAHATFDSIQCPDALSTRQGSSTACMVRKGSQSALMTARLESFEPATGHFQVDCKVADHPLR